MNQRFDVGDQVTPLPFLLDNNLFAKGVLTLGHIYIVETANPVAFMVDGLGIEVNWTNSERFWRLISKKSTAFSLGEIE